MKTVKSFEKIKKEFLEALDRVHAKEDLDNITQRFFSRKSGALAELMNGLKTLSGKARIEYGKMVNDLKQEWEKLYAEKEKEILHAGEQVLLDKEAIDVTQPPVTQQRRGHLHPVSIVQYELEDLFSSMGFTVLDGPELESDYYNFEALNFPPDHPARDMQDTFTLKDFPGLVMRTQTSTMQIRGMETYGAPLRVIVPGRCFRNEATDARHEHTFYQLEGLVVDKGSTFADMKGVLEAVAKHLYGEKTQLRLRPKFYPFVEPGVNGEVSCFLCEGRGCRVCKQTGWLEIFGAGMVHPSVLRSGNVDPDVYQGFAFGFGLTRLVMLKYGIDDIRHLQSGDLRFLEQF